MSDSYNSSAYVAVTNNLPKPGTVHLCWKYSDDQCHSTVQQNIGPGQSTQYVTVGYNTGFLRTGGSYWWIQVTTEDGTWTVDAGSDAPWYRCDLTSDDNGARLTFTVTENTFVMGMHGSCRQSMSKTGGSAPC